MSHPFAKIALVGGLLSTAVGIYGHLDNRIHYCDRRTTPCTPAIVVAESLPRTATVIEVLPGSGLTRTLGGIIAIACFSSGMAATVRADKREQQRKLEAEKLEAEQAKRKQILEKEEEAKLAIAADMRVALFEREIKEASALLYLEQHPELVELLAQQSTSVEMPEQAEIEVKEAGEEQPAELSPKEKLTQLIREHEGGWISQLMKKPILIYGDMGGYKSYFAAFLGLCRYYLYGHKIVSICDPHFHQNKEESWKHLVKIAVVGYGAHHDYSEVNTCLEQMYERFKVRTQKDQWVTSIWDEVTNYSLYEDCKKNASLFLRKILSDPRKAHEAPIIISHDDTLEATGGAEGFSKAKERGLIKLELFSDSENQPLFKGKLSGIKDKQGQRIENLEVSIKADWIRPVYVYELFNPKNDSQTEHKVSEKQVEKTFRDQINEFLADCWKAETPETGLQNPIDQSTESTESTEQSTDASMAHSKDLSDSVYESMTFQKVQELFPETDPKSMYESTVAAVDLGLSPAQIVKKVLRCTRDNSHPTRSYNLIGKPLLKWLLQQFDDGTLINKFKEFFE